MGVDRAFDAPFDWHPDLRVIPTPGHTPGSSCLLWRRHGGCLFTGDHLLPDGDRALGPVRMEATDDWTLQRASAQALLAQPWNHAFPARGAMALPKGFVMRGREKLASWAAGEAEAAPLG
jgi:glyoxylase-like metal-dependent hydrolase (beta-lactamase superfamily II)